VLVGVAVEREEPTGFGRCRMVPIPDASAETLRCFLVENVEPGAKVITDGWQSYPGATKQLYVHEPLKGASGQDASKLLPGVHKVSSLAKRWLLGTHQGSVDEAHLASYLNEFAFRFNRRRSRSRGLVFYRVLELAVAHKPVRYREIVANPSPARPAARHPGLVAGRPPSSGAGHGGHGGALRRSTPVKWKPHYPANELTWIGFGTESGARLAAAHGLGAFVAAQRAGGERSSGERACVRRRGWCPRQALLLT